MNRTDSPASLGRLMLFASAVVGCSSPLYASRDASVDVASEGVGADVEPTNDRGATDDVAVDAGPRYDPCAAEAVIDLNTYGILRGNVTRITRSNRDVPEPSGLLFGGCGRPGYEVAFRYTPRLNRWLRVSTYNPGTDVGFDTVVWALTACAPAATAIGCSDDDGVAPRVRTSAFTTTARSTTGIPVYIVVAGRVPAREDAPASQGEFELTITELDAIAAGGTCDPLEGANHCLEGFVCRAAAGATVGICTGAGG